jgi:rhomboid family GlyGly-CTERM serine protease
MGLHQGDTSHEQTGTIAAWLPVLVAVGIAVILAACGDAARDWLAFSRPAIGDGQLWRLLTGHFVHLGLSHLLLNLAGLMLVWYLVSASFRTSDWLAILLIVIGITDAGLWFLEPQLTWYVGLSGILHGLLAAGIVGAWRSGRRELRILGIALLAKIVYEQLVGPLPGSEESTGGAVIVAAHLYGGVAGVCAAAMIMIRVRPHASI